MSNVIDLETIKTVRESAEFMATLRNALAETVVNHKDGPAGLAIIAGLALFLEAAKDYCDDEDELEKMKWTAQKLADDFYSEITSQRTTH